MLRRGATRLTALLAATLVHRGCVGPCLSAKRNSCNTSGGMRMIGCVPSRLALVLIAVLALAAPVPSSYAGSETEKPRYGGIYVRNNIYSDPPSMDPAFTVGAAANMIQMNIYDGLVKLDPDRGTVVPDLAERWTHSPDGKTFTFYLRKGVTYHDGSEVTAADFKYHFERVANPATLSPHMGSLAGVVGLKAFQEKQAEDIAGIRVLDRHTLQIAMERPNILLPYQLTAVWASAVPRRVVERLGREFGTRPVGSGPFMFERWERGREVALKRYPNYWRRDKWGNRLPYLDGLVFRLIRDMAAVEAEMAAGNIDSAWITDPAYLRYKNHPVFRKHLLEAPEFYTWHVGFNLSMAGAPWADKRVRKAVNHAIDRKTIVDVVRQGKAYVARGFLPSAMFGADPTFTGYEYDPEKAKRLLAEAGYANGFTSKILSSDSQSVVPVVEAILGYLNAVGIRLQYEVLDSVTARVRQQGGRFELYVGTVGGYGHPLIYLQRGFHSRFAGPGGNYTRYSNPRVDQLLDRAAEARDTNTMVRLIREAEKVIMDDARSRIGAHLYEGRRGHAAVRSRAPPGASRPGVPGHGGSLAGLASQAPVAPHPAHAQVRRSPAGTGASHTPGDHRNHVCTHVGHPRRRHPGVRRPEDRNPGPRGGKSGPGAMGARCTVSRPVR